MNENDIEKLIAQLPRPSPSDELDGRIAELVGGARSRPPKTLLVRRVLTLAATAACAGGIGFALGRRSVSTLAGNQEVVESAASALPPDSAKGIAPVRIVQQEDEAIARFVLPPRPFVNLFGNSRLEERQGSSKVE